ncbi:hypothetical protein [Microbacterium sp. CFBP 8794]|uniref:hypothetical protein n=1 Tax=Microbacterium sp. CFBP 8794 TaxID=2775269 RepID=UPI001A913174|nr:hypothetical protein [Microbacterium sp. CFBP 8794]
MTEVAASTDAPEREVLNDLADPNEITTGNDGSLSLNTEGSTTVIPGTSDEPITIGNVAIGMPDTKATVQGERIDDAVISFDGADGVTTVPVLKDDGSVQVTTIINDESAPTHYDYDLTLPDGTTLTLDNESGVVIAMEEEKLVIGIAPAWAVDANGRAVATHYGDPRVNASADRRSHRRHGRISCRGRPLDGTATVEQGRVRELGTRRLEYQAGDIRLGQIYSNRRPRMGAGTAHPQRRRVERGRRTGADIEQQSDPLPAVPVPRSGRLYSGQRRALLGPRRLPRQPTMVAHRRGRIPLEVQLVVTRTMTRRVVLIVSGAIAAAAISAMLAIALFVILTRDTRQDIDLGSFDYASVDDPALHGYTEATEELCRDVDGCIQGYRADHAKYRKFTTTDAGAAFATSAADTYRSNWIVIEYTDDHLTEADRDSIERYIDTLNTSD